MNPRVLLGVVAGLAVAALGVREALSLTGDEQPREAQDVELEPSKVVPLRDGGTGYAQRVRAIDGGEVTRLVQPECVRRLADAGVNACRQRLDDGGVRDPGALNRFPADAAVGTRCQKVACSVFLGDDADEEEDVAVTRERTRDGGGR